MFARVLLLFRARLRGAGPEAGLPWAAMLTHALAAVVLFSLASDVLPPFAYGVFALSVAGALLALPLLGDLGPLLEVDPAERWASSLPARPVERRAARALHALVVLWSLALGSLVPAAWFAPAETGALLRVALVLCGLGLAAFEAAVLLVARRLLGGRAEAVLVALQTILVVGVIVGLATGVRHLPELARLPRLDDAYATWLRLFPPAWFAAPLGAAEGAPSHAWLPLLVGLASLAALCALPPIARTTRAGGEPFVGVLLRPVRALAGRLWVRADERAAFEFVWDALPRERDFAVRTYPMLGIPLAFLLVAATGEQGTARDGLLALLLFSAGVYMPVLLVQVPGCASAEARWLLETAPTSRGALEGGTLKALTARFVVPLYLALGVLAVLWSGPAALVRLALPGLILTHIVLRSVYRSFVTTLPLSVHPDELQGGLNAGEVLMGIAFVLTIAAVLVSAFVTTILAGVVLTVVLVGLELFFERSFRRGDL